MAQISVSAHVLQWHGQAEVYAPDDGFSPSVTLHGRDPVRSSAHQLSGLTPDEADTIATELVAAATRCRRLQAQMPATGPDGAPVT